MKKDMRIKTEEDINTQGLGNPSVPGGYNKPQIGVGTATQAGPNPDQKLTAATAAITPNGIDPLNKGFSVGGAHDPLAEYEAAVENPAGLGIGTNNANPPSTAPMNHPSHAPTINMTEDGIALQNEVPMQNSFPLNNGCSLQNGAPLQNANPFGEENPFAETNPFGEANPFAEENPIVEIEDDEVVVEGVDAIPTLEDIAGDPSIAALPVDATGVIDPIVVPDEVIVEPELGVIPDVVLPFEEPIIEIDNTDFDVQIPENVFENNGIPESIPVVESFKLPENQRMVISKGDQIFLIGHVREEFTPKFAESVFTRALKSLCESKGGGHVVVKGTKNEKVALVGRSVLVEVAKDWRLPGTNVIFEANDLLQIVSAKPIREGEETKEEEDDKKAENDKKKENDKAKEADEEKLKKEAFLAYRRWREAKGKKEDDDSKKEEDDDIDEDDDSDEAAKKKEKAKKEKAYWERQKNRGLI